MTPAVAQAGGALAIQRTLFDAAPAATRRGASGRPGGGTLALGLRLDSAWEGVTAAGRAPCPLCPGELRPAGGEGATCTSCATTLA